MTRFAVQNGMLSAGGPPVAQVERASGRRVARVNVGQARTEPVPLRASFAGGRGRAPVVVPAVERAKAIGPSGRHETQNVSRTQPYAVKPERAVRQPAPPLVREHVNPAPPPHQNRKPRSRQAPEPTQPPPAARVEKPPAVQPKPQGPPPQAHGNPPGKEKNKEHGNED